MTTLEPGTVTMLNDAFGQAVEAAKVTAAPVKRGRGRPPKAEADKLNCYIGLKLHQTEFDALNALAAQMAQERGEFRKNPKTKEVELKRISVAQVVRTLLKPHLA